jgi:pyruvate formate lyase activating enzyme
MFTFAAIFIDHQDMHDSSKHKGLIFDIKRFAVHDGPGIRTTVFLKGCPLSCRWCHNPEGISPDRVTVPKTIRMGDKRFTENETVGRLYSVKELMEELLKEKIFMEESGGGVTFSGGEPLMQFEFLFEMLKQCHSEGLSTAVDTSGFTPWDRLEKIAPFTDLFLYDLKIVDDEDHKKYTDVSNRLILENLNRLSVDKHLIRIRIPLIPGITFNEQNVNGLLDFLGRLPQKPAGVDLLPWHNTAAHKYKRFNLKNDLSTFKSLEKSSLQNLKQRFEHAGYLTSIGG